MISTIILKVDLECNLCYKKIRKTLCKLQGREKIQSIAYDDKKNTVTISGPFDPENLSKKLYCNAYKVIKDIQFVGSNDKKEKPKDSKPPAEPAKPEKEKTKPAEPAKPPKAQAEPAKPDKEKPKAQPESAKPADPAAKPLKPALKQSSEPVVVAAAAQMTYTGYPSVWQTGPVCNCGPWHEPYYGGPGCRCQSYNYGVNYGWVSEGPPAEGPNARDFFSEEDPNSSCSIM